MGNLILCTKKTAQHPFLIQPSEFPVFSLEELCYYIEQNFYLLDKNLINHELVSWLSDELEYVDLAAELEKSLSKPRSMYPCALLILKKSCLYGADQIQELEQLFEDMDGKTVMECRKMKADQYLAQEKYSLAVMEYDRLLKKENLCRMTDELRGSLYHNKGVAYARMFLFPEAAECFLEAYRQNPDPRSREAYLFALNYMKDEEQEDATVEMHLNFETMREAFGKFQEVSNSSAYFTERERLVDLSGPSARITRDSRHELLDSWKKKYMELV